MAQTGDTKAAFGAAKAVHLAFNPQHQNVDSLHRALAQILGRAGCGTCGRIARLGIEFVGDPGPELAKDGVISVIQEAAGRLG